MDHQLNKAAKGALYASLLQVLIRVSTFVLNGVIIQYTSLEALGVVNVRLMLLYNTVLFLSREPARKACLSRSSETRDWILVLNLSWTSVLVGLFSSIALSLVWLSPTIMDQPDDHDGYTVGVVLFCIGALFELLTEPLVILGQAHQYVTTKVLVEALSQLCRCGFIVAVVMWVPDCGVTALSLANLSYSVTYILLYYTLFYCHHYEKLPVKGILPRSTQEQNFLDTKLLKLAWTFLKQSIIKQLLTDGEKYIIAYFHLLTYSKQAVYDAINNLGSLVPRLIFQPIEENFNVYFANSFYRGKPAKEQPKDMVELAAQLLTMLLKLVILIALVMFTFGYSYSFLLLDIYGSTNLTSGDGHWLLRMYCMYVLFLAVNGVTESFTFAMMSREQVDRQIYLLAPSSVIYLLTTYLFVGVCGSIGLILGNCVNMTVRILLSLRFITDFFSTTPYSPLKHSIPSMKLLLAFAITLLVTALSEMYCCEHGLLWRSVHVGVGLICLCCLLLVTVFIEQELSLFAYKRLPDKLTRMLDPLMKHVIKLHSE